MNGLVHAHLLRETAREQLEALLATLVSPITLVVEKPLISVLDLLFKFSELESIGISRIAEWSLETSDLNESEGSVVFCLRSLSKDTLPLMTRLAEFTKKKHNVDCHVWFCPFVCKLALNRLQALGVNVGSDLKSVQSVSALQFAPIENDVVSLELGSDAFSDFHCRADPSLLVHVSQAVSGLQAQFGIGVGHEEVPVCDRRIRRISAIGTSAKFVADSVIRQPVERTYESSADSNRVGGIDSVAGLLLEGSDSRHGAAAAISNAEESFAKASSSDAIDSVILIDRRTDLFSVLCSQFTYEARIDEEFDISNRRVSFKPSDSPGEISMTLCKSVDPLFAEIRDVSVSTIGQLLSKKANFISQCYKEKDALQSISEVKDFMEKFKVIQAQHASLTNHVSLATCVSDLTKDPNYMYLLKVEDQIMSLSKPAGKILSKIEALMTRNDEFFTVNRILRLLCLACQTYGSKAITGAGLEKVLKTLVQVFGFPVIKTLHHLEQCGLLRFHNPSETNGVMAELISTGSKWPRIRDEFSLISADSGEVLAEAYSGYVPLSVRLVQMNTVSWKSSADKLNLLRGPALEIAQECPIASAGNSNSIIVAVVFIGGVTYGEIAALRKLSSLEGGRRRFLIVTTGITSYNRVISGM